MDTRHMPFIVRWANGTYSIFIGTGTYPIDDILDERGDASGAEARQIPPKFAGFICLDQDDVGEKFELEWREYFTSIDELWNACKKRLYPPWLPKSVDEPIPPLGPVC